jgi:hypothetical protein
MRLDKVMQAFGFRLPLSLRGWKVAIAMGAAIVLAPVLGLVLLFVVGMLIPVLPLMAMFFVRFWLIDQHSRLPSTSVQPLHVLRPRMSHASAP